MDSAFMNPQVFTVVGVACVIITAAIITVVRRHRRPKRFSRKTEALLSILVFASGGLGMLAAFNIQQGVMNGARLTSIQETYGITMSPENLEELRIPRGAPPAPEEGQYTSYGVTQVVKDGKVLTVFVSWDGEGFELRDSDGKPLPRAD